MKQLTLTAAEFRARRCGAKVPGGKYHVADKADRTADGIVFASKKEMQFYQGLKIRRNAGEGWFLRQVAFHLPGKTKCVLDFLWIPADVEVIPIDTKGHRTETYRLKKRQVEELYPVKIQEL